MPRYELYQRVDDEWWWEHVDVPPVGDEWMARQVVAYHATGSVPCAFCKRQLVCPRLTEAKEILGL
ncbi:hypothetical protein [Asanoa siamensis]|uniref:Uncharacterized protein n=1 Tax=Asanoa siamensis TaxID=926357 RepID=A0ABQ4CLR9_9ACTN|nr:hypothetical protein [Asanoa siamensis]GIF71918.1 hypothetical protein Asi02nite_14360 [Asanoa siamensis]